jgi:hypothetical protein
MHTITVSADAAHTYIELAKTVRGLTKPDRDLIGLTRERVHLSLLSSGPGQLTTDEAEVQIEITTEQAEMMKRVLRTCVERLHNQTCMRFLNRHDDDVFGEMLDRMKEAGHCAEMLIHLRALDLSPAQDANLANTSPQPQG